ncbi:MAG: TraR/DksA family transcriptional regulator [Desulfobacteraceae bacterium]|nr:TraR/DksA family transcriptional regulator [Desulfobacteraceae bacterium]
MNTPRSPPPSLRSGRGLLGGKVKNSIKIFIEELKQPSLEKQRSSGLHLEQGICPPIIVVSSAVYLGSLLFSRKCLIKYLNQKEKAMTKDLKTRRRMTTQELEKIIESLLKREEELWLAIEEDLRENAGKEYHDLMETIRDDSDKALAELEESTVLSYIKLKLEEVQSIQQALVRLKDGEYGRCLDCGCWIRPARLQVVPHAARCISCQEAIEKWLRG